VREVNVRHADRAPSPLNYESWGHEFESLRARHCTILRDHAAADTRQAPVPAKYAVMPGIATAAVLTLMRLSDGAWESHSHPLRVPRATCRKPLACVPKLLRHLQTTCRAERQRPERPACARAKRQEMLAGNAEKLRNLGLGLAGRRNHVLPQQRAMIVSPQ